MRDYGTAKWEGGDVDCQHIVGGQVQDSKAPGAITAGVRPGVDASQCKKCGARRVDPQLGLEKTPEEYISKMVEVFREVKRIMHPTGTLWLNMGDCYASRGPMHWNEWDGNNKLPDGSPRKNRQGKFSIERNTGLKPKDLLEMPSRLVLALQAPYESDRIIKMETQRAWLAAFIDGEGCIGIRRHDSYSSGRDGGPPCQDGFVPYLSVGNNDIELLEHCVKITGRGSVRVKDRPSPDKRGIVSRRTYYGWRLDGNSAIDVIREVYPYLIAKRKQAVLAYSLDISNKSGRRIRGNKKVPVDIQEQRRWLYESIKKSNQREPVDIPNWCQEPKRKLEDGWWLRTRIPWIKRNSMPESCQDRPTQAVEYVFLLTKSGTAQYWTHRDKDGVTKQPKADWRWVNQITQEEIKTAPADWKEMIPCPNCGGTGIVDLSMICDMQGVCPECKGKKEVQRWKRVNLWQGHDYFYDGESVRVKSTGQSGLATNFKRASKESDVPGQSRRQHRLEREATSDTGGRSLRNSDFFFQSWQGLWTDENGEPLAFIVNPKPYKRAHFATFPPGLVIPCIKAGTSERGCCPECRNPWVRVIKKTMPKTRKTDSISAQERSPSGPHGQLSDTRWDEPIQTKTLGWRPTCGCGKEPVPCLAVDPFAGTGTVIEVARKMGRSGLGFEISGEYVKKYCGERLAQEVLGLTCPKEGRKAEGK